MRYPETENPLYWPANKSALIISDAWNTHWSRGATERLNELAPRMNNFVKRLRESGVLIVHCPTHVMAAYEDTRRV